MTLHENKDLFSDIIDAASRSKSEGGLGILAPFIEKDYWITRSLQMMSRADNLENAVFKGGTSLTKGYGIGNRFSEDIDIAIADAWTFSGNQLKMLIKRTSKAMTEGLVEVVKPSTSKGSRYHKAYYSYPRIGNSQLHSYINNGELLVEINSFANPYPYEKRRLVSFIYDFLTVNNSEDIIDEYDLHPFEINVLDRRRTLTEKIVSLFRASLGEDYEPNLKAKIRHFYDLHFLWEDAECKNYLTDSAFLLDFNSLIEHDRELFKDPMGWQTRALSESPLLINFSKVWAKLAPVYERELSSLAYAKIPDSKSVLNSVVSLLSLFR
ncbi:MAG: nucleotidyl transferase AbiEii/AbiGii toxin family protein [Muribaculaceae bacterium]|nr:nucleotidyl transferase AbiEii/AbiGii toxin family protein [Muribaculaceae bacterium]